MLESVPKVGWALSSDSIICWPDKYRHKILNLNKTFQVIYGYIPASKSDSINTEISFGSNFEED
jgi:hypothetical protein